jgi:hypothetical protein
LNLLVPIENSTDSGLSNLRCTVSAALMAARPQIGENLPALDIQKETVYIAGSKAEEA